MSRRARDRSAAAVRGAGRDSPAAARAGRRRRLGKIGEMSKFAGRDTANTVVLNLNMEQRKAKLKRKPCLKFAVCVV
ncbi:serine protease inhibitor Kazal-type 2 isoform X3 [Chelonia mydas]|uniref:serine protease inhibitor Kazal-type 2 isoform X3 n=1 Tax=Chelonia mydas TaxID=8469 RepID=UPI001CA9F5B4|nr:serine protease inhibitor Kazal-type 2 isoform X3 [Chelonia mydas]